MPSLFFQLLHAKLIDSQAREVSERKATVRQLEAEKGVVEDEAQNCEFIQLKLS